MSKTLKIILSVLAVVAIAAGVSYAIYRYLNGKQQEPKKPLAVFKSKFNDDGTVDAIDISEEILDTAPLATEEVAEAVEEAAAPAPKCDDAVCAVDMCMPY